MKKAFLSINYKNKDLLNKEINCITNTLRKFSIQTTVFVYKYSFKSNQERKMMGKAFEQIKNSDILIAEVSEKAIGIGIEIGFAKALNKPIIYLKKENSKYSTTVGGTADIKIVYKNLEDLEEKLFKLFFSNNNKCNFSQRI